MLMGILYGFLHLWVVPLELRNFKCRQVTRILTGWSWDVIKVINMGKMDCDCFG